MSVYQVGRSSVGSYYMKEIDSSQLVAEIRSTGRPSLGKAGQARVSLTQVFHHYRITVVGLSREAYFP